MSSNGRAPLPVKVELALAVWLRFLLVRALLLRTPLPEVVARLGATRPRAARRHSAARLSRAVDRSLRVGSRQPRCLVSALVLYRLLREQGDEAELVIGLPAAGRDKQAHAWVELGGRDVGPPPGRGSHLALARFGR